MVLHLYLFYYTNLLSTFYIDILSLFPLPTYPQSTPSQHPVFGKVVEGYDIIQKINHVETDRNDKPLTPVVVNKIVIID